MHYGRIIALAWHFSRSIWHEYKELIRRNLEIDFMYERYPLDHEMIDSICDLIVETLVSKNAMIVISSDRYPAELVKAKID